MTTSEQCFVKFIAASKAVMVAKAELKEWRHMLMSALDQAESRRPRGLSRVERGAYIKKECGVFYDALAHAEQEVVRLQKESDEAWRAYERSRGIGGR
jgi:hypothetical protein